VFDKSDPKKLEALMQFDKQNISSPACGKVSQSTGRVGGQASCVYASDPAKEAYLRQFDESNIRTEPESIIQQTQREEEEAVLASDPKKIATLTRFDNANVGSGCSAPRQRSDTNSSGASGGGGNSLVSQEDFLVSSQREAWESCKSMQQSQPDRQTRQDSNQSPVSGCGEQLLHCNIAGSATQRASETDDSCAISEDVTVLIRRHNVDDGCAASSENPTQLVQNDNANTCVSSENPSLLLQKRNNFFDMYMYEQMKAEEDDEGDDDYDDNNDCDGEGDYNATVSMSAIAQKG
jgi:hypothetical protein